MSRCLAVCAVLAIGAACGDSARPSLGLTRVFRAADVAGCTYASPVVATPPGAATLVAIATTDGAVVAYDLDGALRWQTALPAEAGERAWIGATPVVIDDARIAVAWQDTAAAGDARRRHRVAVLDAATGAVDPAFPIATLAATAAAPGGGRVGFLPSNAFSRSQLVHARRAGDTLGAIYVSFGN